jgi:hypothetical protein
MASNFITKLSDSGDRKAISAPFDDKAPEYMNPYINDPNINMDQAGTPTYNPTVAGSNSEDYWLDVTSGEQGGIFGPTYTPQPGEPVVTEPEVPVTPTPTPTYTYPTPPEPVTYVPPQYTGGNFPNAPTFGTFDWEYQDNPWLDQVYSNQQDAARIRNEAQIAAANSALDAEQAKVQPYFYDARRGIQAGSDLNQRRLNEFLASRGQSMGGAAVQTAMGVNSDLQGNLGAARRDEAMTLADIERRRSDAIIQANYQLDATMADIEAAKAQGIIDDRRYQEEMAWAQYQYGNTMQQIAWENQMLIEQTQYNQWRDSVGDTQWGTTFNSNQAQQDWENQWNVTEAQIAADRWNQEFEARYGDSADADTLAGMTTAQVAAYVSVRDTIVDQFDDRAQALAHLEGIMNGTISDPTISLQLSQLTEKQQLALYNDIAEGIPEKIAGEAEDATSTQKRYDTGFENALDYINSNLYAIPEGKDPETDLPYVTPMLDKQAALTFIKGEVARGAISQEYADILMNIYGIIDPRYLRDDISGQHGYIR